MRPYFLLWIVIMPGMITSGCGNADTSPVRKEKTAKIADTTAQLKVPPCHEDHANRTPDIALTVIGLDTSVVFQANGKNQYYIRYDSGESGWQFLRLAGDTFTQNDELTFIAQATDPRLGIRHAEVLVVMTLPCNGNIKEVIHVKPKAMIRDIAPVGSLVEDTKTDTYTMKLTDLFAAANGRCNTMPFNLEISTLAYNHNHCPGTVTPAGRIEGAKISFVFEPLPI